ncbi:MAG: ATP-dependent Clp protease ATP-binding subunit ClpX [Bacilli bacterium]|nr:ATP-dependent Clp protease ATP-binding subunit ClpX [Bacilli bacterium]MDD7315448.1 ATP-dependent Clp protease ATP-binding subunit ClpX [Bacilli bacterium]MDY4052319.1 ATP-dependent Clp protease ATP-binding subunit ClpX [Bacilli bacterium]
MDKHYCSFCNREITIENFGVEGNHAWMCMDCLELYYELLNFDKKEVLNSDFLKETAKENISPRYIYDKLSEMVISQDNAKKVLAVALYEHYKRITCPELDDLEKPNILMIGPTGVGKTLLAKSMASILNLPLAICDATVYTQAGYVGEDVENILLKLLQNADYDLELAQKGIVFIDEFDKLARKGENPSITRDVSGEGVQNSLLKIIEGNIVNVPPQGGRKHPYQEYLKFDTSKVLFICAGSFEGLDKVKNNVVGFENTTQKDQNLIDTRKLQKFGIIPEILGRLPIITRLEPLTLEDLEKILTLPKKAITKEYERLFKSDNIRLIFSESAIKEIAKKAFDEGTGARALRKIIEERMLDVMFELPYNNEINQIIIEKENIEYNLCKEAIPSA